MSTDHEAVFLETHEQRGKEAHEQNKHQKLETFTTVGEKNEDLKTDWTR